MDPSITMPELATARLRLRPFCAGDADAIVAIADDLAVARMTADLPHPFDPADARAWLRHSDDEHRYGIEQEGRLIGSVGYYLSAPGVGELGFFLARACWGRGLAIEAAAAVIAQGFDSGHVDAFGSSHLIDNGQSASVLKRLGFTPVGQVSVWCRSRGQLVPALTYRLDSAARAGISHQPSIGLTPAGMGS